MRGKIQDPSETMKLVVLLLFALAITTSQGFDFGIMAPSPSCGDKLTSSAVLKENLYCDCSERPALVIDGEGIELDLNGFDVNCGNNTADGGFHAWKRVGIKVKGKNNCVVGPGNVTDTNVGVILDGDGGHLLHRTTVEGCGNDCLRILSDSNKVRYSSVGGASDDAIQIDSDRNTIVDSGFGFSLREGINVNGDYNVIERVVGAGLGGDMINLAGFRNEVIDSYIAGAASDGIAIDDGPGGHIIRGNRITLIGTGGTDRAVEIEGTEANDVHIENNHIFSNEDDGIYVRNGSGPYPTNIVIKGNVVTGGKDDGIRLAECNNCHVIGNIAHNNYWSDGIRVSYGTGNQVVDNIISNSGQDGLQIDNAASGTVYSRNSIGGNGDDLDDQGSGSIAVGDNVIDNPLDGGGDTDKPEDEEEEKPDARRGDD